MWPRRARLPDAAPASRAAIKFLEAFASNYCNFADTIRAKCDKRKATPEEQDFPGVEAGVRGMKFINAVVSL